MQWLLRSLPSFPFRCPSPRSAWPTRSLSSEAGSRSYFVMTYAVLGGIAVVTAFHVVPPFFGVLTKPVFFENALAKKLTSWHQIREHKREELEQYQEQKESLFRPSLMPHPYRFHSEYLATLFWRLMKNETFKHRVDVDCKKFIFSIFVADRLDVLPLGSTRSSCGVSLGLPVFFDFHRHNDIDLNMLVHKTRYVPNFLSSLVTWKLMELMTLDENDMLKLKNTLLLSENAKLFAMAEALATAESIELAKDAVALPLAISIPYVINLALKDLFHLRVRWTPWARALMYAILAALAAYLYLDFMDKNQRNWEKKTRDQVLKTAENGEPLILEGAVEYYEKMEERNLLLRQLLKDGHKLFDEDGDLRRSTFSVPKQWTLREKVEFYKEQIKIRDERGAHSTADGEKSGEDKETVSTRTND